MNTKIYRHAQTALLVQAFQEAGIMLLVDEVETTDHDHPHAFAGEDFIRGGQGSAFVFKNVDGGQVIRCAPPDNPRNGKRRELALHSMRNADEAFKLVQTYSITFCDP